MQSITWLVPLVLFDRQKTDGFPRIYTVEWKSAKMTQKIVLLPQAISVCA